MQPRTTLRSLIALVIASGAMTALVLPPSTAQADAPPPPERPMAHDRGDKGDKDKPGARADHDDKRAEADKGDDKDKDKGRGDVAREDEDDDDDVKTDTGNDKEPKKGRKNKANEELFGGDDAKPLDAARVEVHARGERAAERAKVEAILNGAPMSKELKEELRRHALTTAKLMRIRELARAAKDSASVGKVKELVKQEQTRHDAWVTAFKATAAKGAAK